MAIYGRESVQLGRRNYQHRHPGRLALGPAGVSRALGGVPATMIMLVALPRSIGQQALSREKVRRLFGAAVEGCTQAKLPGRIKNYYNIVYLACLLFENNL